MSDEKQEQDDEPRGRKPLPDEVRKSRMLQIRVTEKEHAHLKAAAEKAGSTFSQWALGVLLDAAGPVPRSGSSTTRASTSTKTSKPKK